jgi:hypothetical protein
MDNPLVPPLWRWTDFVLIPAVIALAVALVSGYRPAPGKNVTISVDGKTLASYPLGEERTVTVTGSLGPVDIQIEKTGVRIERVPCPHQRCVKQGEIKSAGQVLICLPSRLVVEITGPDTARADGLAF